MSGLRRRGAQLAAVAAVAALFAVPTVTMMRSDNAGGSIDARQAGRGEVIAAATEGVQSVLSYRADTVVDDVAAARDHLTGDFLTYYSGFADSTIVPGATDRGLTSSATVSGASVASIDGDRAVTLLFVDQNITSANSADPRSTSTSLRVVMDRVDGRWLVSALDPV